MNKLLALAVGLLATFGIVAGTVLSDDITVTTDVSGYITATFNYASVAYGSQSANSHDTPAPSQADGVYNVSVDTNQNYKVRASGTQFDDGGGHTFAIGNLKMDTNTNPASLANTTATVLTGSLQDIDTGYTPSDTLNYHGYYLSIPSAQFASSYSSTVTVQLTAS